MIIDCDKCQSNGFITCDCWSLKGENQVLAPTEGCPKCEGFGDIDCSACGGDGTIEVEDE